MNERKTCFISYPYGDRTAEQLVRKVLEPALAEAGWVWADPQRAATGEPIFSRIAADIRRADLFIADVSANNANVNYELGMAHAWGKQSAVFSRSLESVPFDLAVRFRVVVYSRDTLESPSLFDQVVTLLQQVRDQPLTLADPGLHRYVATSQTIALEILSPDVGAVGSLRFAAAVTEQLDRLDDLTDAALSEVRLGSFGVWISSSVESLANLVEKILFFVPEWRIKNAERIKIEAEADLLLARAERKRAEAASIARSANREDAALLLDIIRKSNMPARITFGDQLRIETGGNGDIVIGLPVKHGRGLPGGP